MHTEAEIPDKMFFRIGEVADLIGVEPHVLRYWETEFKLRPQRSPTGQRMYRRRHIQRFFTIRHLLHDEKYTIAGARQALASGGTTEASKPAAADQELVQAAVSRLRVLKDRVEQARVRFATPFSNGSHG